MRPKPDDLEPQKFFLIIMITLAAGTYLELQEYTRSQTSRKENMQPHGPRAKRSTLIIIIIIIRNLGLLRTATILHQYHGILEN
jgi:hypothetical protein